jgi:hypothetical protein
VETEGRAFSAKAQRSGSTFGRCMICQRSGSNRARRLNMTLRPTPECE